MGIHLFMFYVFYDLRQLRRLGRELQATAEQIKEVRVRPAATASVRAHTHVRTLTCQNVHIDTVQSRRILQLKGSEGKIKIVQQLCRTADECRAARRSNNVDFLRV